MHGNNIGNKWKEKNKEILNVQHAAEEGQWLVEVKAQKGAALNHVTYTSSLHCPNLREEIRLRSCLIRIKMATLKTWLWPLQNAENLHSNPLSSLVKLY